jgi:hypothetical protein
VKPDEHKFETTSLPIPIDGLTLILGVKLDNLPVPRPHIRSATSFGRGFRYHCVRCDEVCVANPVRAPACGWRSPSGQQAKA